MEHPYNTTKKPRERGKACIAVIGKRLVIGVSVPLGRGETAKWRQVTRNEIEVKCRTAPGGKLTSPRLMLCSRPRPVHQQDEAHVARRLRPFLLLSNASVRKGVSHRHLSERLAARRLALPLSELSGDADGLADSCVCKFSISAFLVSRSCWRLLISACWGRHSEKWHQLGRAALQTCTMCALQKAMFNRTYISSLTSIYSVRSK